MLHVTPPCIHSQTCCMHGLYMRGKPCKRQKIGQPLRFDCCCWLVLVHGPHLSVLLHFGCAHCSL